MLGASNLNSEVSLIDVSLLLCRALRSLDLGLCMTPVTIVDQCLSVCGLVTSSVWCAKEYNPHGVVFYVLVPRFPMRPNKSLFDDDAP